MAPAMLSIANNGIPAGKNGGYTASSSSSFGTQETKFLVSLKDGPKSGKQKHRSWVPLVAKNDSSFSPVIVKAEEEKTKCRNFVSRYTVGEARKGADILVEALEREGVEHVFAYPGGASLEIHQALTRSRMIRNVLCRHEQGEIFAAEGYARSSGKVGVCIATSGPGATNLVSGLADASMDSIPLVAITGQVPRRMMGTDAFQETPIVEVTRSITKHNYLILDVDDIPRVIKEAFFIAASGRPGPVLIDIPKDVQQQMAVPTWIHTMKIHAYIQRLPKPPKEMYLEQILRLLYV
jgi:acetolactate synthase-1/2/3 large subunit